MSAGTEASGPADWLAMVEDCENRESKLTEWERGFVDDMKHILGKGGGLNVSQASKLDEIWERVT